MPSSPNIKGCQKKREMQKFLTVGFNGDSSLERERLLSKNTDDPTVGRLRDKKEKCSMRRGLRVGTGFREFLQTP